MNTLPIYYIVVEYHDYQMTYTVGRILMVFECDITDIDRLYREHVVPLQYQSGGRINTVMFYRQPSSSFLGAANATQALPEPIPQVIRLPACNAGDEEFEAGTTKEDEPEIPYYQKVREEHQKIWDEL